MNNINILTDVIMTLWKLFFIKFFILHKTIEGLYGYCEVLRESFGIIQKHKRDYE